MGIIIKPSTAPTVMILELMGSSPVQLKILLDISINIKMPKINATRDKNNNQRIRDFRVK